MKVLSNAYTAKDQARQPPLILRQRTTVPKHDMPILFQESCLSLAQDQQHVVLRRYFERYGPSGAEWVEYAHTISTADLIHWIMTHGQLRIECSENTPPKQACV